MALLASMLASHMVADYPLQTDWMAANKHESEVALTAHAATHFGVTTVLVAVSTRDISLAITAAVLVAFLHRVIDGLGLSLRWDQTMHLFIIVFIWAVISP